MISSTNIVIPRYLGIVCSTLDVEATFSTAHGYALLLVVPASGPITTFAALILGCGSRFGSQDNAYYYLDYANSIILVEFDIRISRIDSRVERL